MIKRFLTNQISKIYSNSNNIDMKRLGFKFKHSDNGVEVWSLNKNKNGKINRNKRYGSTL